DHEHRWYSLRIRPYRTRENKIDGAVITLVDIDEEQRSIARLELASHHNDTLLDTIREPLVLLDADLRVRQASRSFYQTFKLTRKKVENTPFFDLGDGEWNLPRLRQLLASLPQKKRLENFKLIQALPKFGRRTWLLNAR